MTKVGEEPGNEASKWLGSISWRPILGEGQWNNDLSTLLPHPPFSSTSPPPHPFTLSSSSPFHSLLLLTLSLSPPRLLTRPLLLITPSSTLCSSHPLLLTPSSPSAPLTLSSSSSPHPLLLTLALSSSSPYPPSHPLLLSTVNGKLEPMGIPITTQATGTSDLPMQQYRTTGGPLTPYTHTNTHSHTHTNFASITVWRCCWDVYVWPSG